MRDREHPLAHGDVGWEDVLDEMCRALGHAPSAAARTEAPPLTGEGEQAFERAVAPANPGEAMGQHPSAEELPELVDDECRQPDTVGVLANRRGGPHSIERTTP